MWKNLDPAVANPDPANAEPVRRVRNVLEGEVSHILRCSLPELRSIPRDAVYDRVMDTPPLLARAFQHFRTNAHLFVGIASPQDEDAELSCGRTLRQAIALIIRAAAKRYFRRYFLSALYRGPMGRLRLRAYLWFGLGKARRHAAKQRACRHFNALYPHLMYEWQIKLFPTYAALPTHAVERLGEQLLACRDAAALTEAAEAALHKPVADQAPKPAVAEERRPRKLWGAPEARVARSRRPPPRHEDILDVAESDELVRLMADVAPPVRKVMAMEVAAVPGEVFHALERGGLSEPEAIALMLLATQALGRDAFAKAFLDGGGARRAELLTRRLGAGRQQLATVADSALASRHAYAA